MHALLTSGDMQAGAQFVEGGVMVLTITCYI